MQEEGVLETFLAGVKSAAAATAEAAAAPSSNGSADGDGGGGGGGGGKGDPLRLSLQPEREQAPKLERCAPTSHFACSCFCPCRFALPLHQNRPRLANCHSPLLRSRRSSSMPSLPVEPESSSRWEPGFLTWLTERGHAAHAEGAPPTTFP